MSTLYPSLEDLKVDQAIQVSSHGSLRDYLRVTHGGLSCRLLGVGASARPAEWSRCSGAQAVELQQEQNRPSSCRQASLGPALPRASSMWVWVDPTP